MPLAAYFRNVGAILFALLLLADYFSPPLPVMRKVGGSMPVIRIFSVEKWPERIVFDTRDAPGLSAARGEATVDVAAAPDFATAPADLTEPPAARKAFAWLRKPNIPPAISLNRHGRRRAPPHRVARWNGHPAP